MTPHIWASSIGGNWSVDHCAHVTCCCSCVLSPCANQWGWFCVLGSCHSLYCNVFFGVHNELSKPFFVLFCFFLSLPPSSPLSYCFPPPLQAVRLSHFLPGQWHRMQSKPCITLKLWRYCTPWHLFLIYPFPPPHTFCCPLVLKRWKARPNDGIHSSEHESFPKLLLQIKKNVCKIIDQSWCRADRMQQSSFRMN